MYRSHDPILPLELQLSILESLQDDKRAMATCGLVCRTWVSPTRHALFEKITLLYHDRATFMDLLLSPHATFANHAESLSIVGDSTLTGSAKFHYAAPKIPSMVVVGLLHHHHSR